MNNQEELMEKNENVDSNLSKGDSIQSIETESVENNKNIKKTINPLVFGKYLMKKAKTIADKGIDFASNTKIGKTVSNLINDIEIKKQFNKQSIGIIAHLLNNKSQNINIWINDEAKEIYSYELIKLKEIKHFENKKLGKYYYINNIDERQREIKVTVKNEEFSFWVYVYKYTNEKPKEEVQPIQNTINIGNYDASTTTLGKNAVMGNNNDNRKNTEVNVSPTIKLPDQK